MSKDQQTDKKAQESQATNARQAGTGESRGETTKSEQGVYAQPPTWNKVMAKRWMYPAMYMVAAAIIIALMWNLQSKDRPVVEEPDVAPAATEGAQDENAYPILEDALPVASTNETMAWPIAEREHTVVLRPYYEPSASNEEKQAAMVQYENTFLPNTGISLGHHNQESFDVLAAQSGEVTRVEQVPLVGTVVEITHSDERKTVYNSLTEVSVSAGDMVKQGDVIAKAGRNEIGKDLGVHLHFEVHEDDQPVNPIEFLPELD